MCHLVGSCAVSTNVSDYQTVQCHNEIIALTTSNLTFICFVCNTVFYASALSQHQNNVIGKDTRS